MSAALGLVTSDEFKKKKAMIGHGDTFETEARSVAVASEARCRKAGEAGGSRAGGVAQKCKAG